MYKNSGLVFWVNLFLFVYTPLWGQQKITDGPYIFHHENHSEILWVTPGKDIIEVFQKDSSFLVCTADGVHTFEVKRHPIYQPDWQYPQPEKIVVVSDPHGNMNAFVSILYASEVIDEEYNWVYGEGHLMILGDIFDRGDEVLPIFWLVYKLEEEARLAGGCVHFLYGNHEDIVLQNDVRYVPEKYLHLSERLGVEHCDLWSIRTELGYWLSTRNTIEVIGENLFTHAGLSTAFLQKNYTIPQVNEIIREYIHKPWEIRYENEDAEFLFFVDGPLWYRGMVGDNDYTPITTGEVEQILNHYNVKRLFVGHTIFEEVTSFFEGRVIAVNVDNQENMEQNRTRGVLIQSDKLYLLYDQPQNNREW